ncbi:MAG: ABC transporter substrate-binding protein [Oscillospiraceae bacterium]
MKKIISLILVGAIVMTMIMSAVLPAFAQEKLLISPAPISQELDPEMEKAKKLADDYDWEKFKGKEMTLNVFNWGEYMSLGLEGTMNVNKAFEEKTGIKVNYQTYANNEEMYTKLKSGGADYDIVIPSDYMIGKMINEDMLQPLDFSLIPNFKVQIDDVYKNSEFDPENKFYVPYTWGVVGIVYNKTMVQKPVTSWDILWDEEYSGNILMFANSRDAFAISLLKNGLSLNPKTQADIDVAKEDLKAQKSVVQAYVNDEIFDKMGGGEAALAPYYAGDAITMMEENPDLGFAIPEEGTNYFVDGVVILKDAANVEAAHMYINFLCQPDVALANAYATGYSTPNMGAYEMLDQERKSNPVAYPSKEVMEKTEVFTVLPDEINTAIDKAWSEIRSFNAKSNSLLMPILFVIALGTLILLTVLRSRKKKKMDY